MRFGGLEVPEFIIRVELHQNQNFPDRKDYERLEKHLQERNWSPTIKGSKGVSRLPGAMFYGISDVSIDPLTSSLKRGIEKQVWSEATVMVIELKDWAMEPG